MDWAGWVGRKERCGQRIGREALAPVSSGHRRPSFYLYSPWAVSSLGKTSIITTLLTIPKLSTVYSSWVQMTYPDIYSTLLPLLSNVLPFSFCVSFSWPFPGTIFSLHFPSHSFLHHRNCASASSFHSIGTSHVRIHWTLLVIKSHGLFSALILPGFSVAFVDVSCPFLERRPVSPSALGHRLPASPSGPCPFQGHPLRWLSWALYSWLSFLLLRALWTVFWFKFLFICQWHPHLYL